MSERDVAASPIECDGGPYCQASPHVHGCFADKGDCDHPSEHQDAARVRPWTRCAVCGFRKWTHLFVGGRDIVARKFYTARSPLTPAPPRRPFPW